MTISQILIPLADTRAWENAIQQVPHYYTHSHWYNQAMQAASKREIVLYYGVNRYFKVVCPLSLRRRNINDYYDISTPYGFSGFSMVGDCPDFFTEWCEFMTQQNFVCAYIALHPLLRFDVNALSIIKHVKMNAYFLDLNQSLESIYQKFSHGHRYVLKQWHKKRIDIRYSKDELSRNSFIALYQQFIKKKEVASIYDFGAQAWDLIFDVEDSFLISVWENDEMVSGAVFILHEKLIDYFMSASTDKGRDHTRGLIWEAIKLGQKKGCERLHLGCGIKSEDSLEQFKSRFGAYSHSTYAVKQLFHQKNYQELCQKYKSDPMNLTGYFPSFWAQ